MMYWDQCPAISKAEAPLLEQSLHRTIVSYSPAVNTQYLQGDRKQNAVAARSTQAHSSGKAGSALSSKAEHDEAVVQARARRWSRTVQYYFFLDFVQLATNAFLSLTPNPTLRTRPRRASVSAILFRNSCSSFLTGSARVSLPTNVSASSLVVLSAIASRIFVV